MYQYLKEIFYALTGAAVIFTILEIIFPGMVLSYLNINWILIFWVIIGIILILKPKLYLKDKKDG